MTKQLKMLTKVEKEVQFLTNWLDDPDNINSGIRAMYKEHLEILTKVADNLKKGS